MIQRRFQNIPSRAEPDRAPARGRLESVSRSAAHRSSSTSADNVRKTASQRRFVRGGAGAALRWRAEL